MIVEQISDFAYGELQASQVRDRSRRFNLTRVVIPIARIGIDVTGNEQLLFVIEAECLHGQVGQPREFADREHGAGSCPVTHGMLQPPARGEAIEKKAMSYERR